MRPSNRLDAAPRFVGQGAAEDSNMPDAAPRLVGQGAAGDTVTGLVLLYTFGIRPPGVSGEIFYFTQCRCF